MTNQEAIKWIDIVIRVLGCLIAIGGIIENVKKIKELKEGTDHV